MGPEGRVSQAEEELEMAWAWLHDRDLMMDYNGKELPPEWALCRYRALSKCQFGDTVDEAAWRTFLCHLLPWEDKLAAVQMDIGWVWDPKYHYRLDLTNAVPIRAKPPPVPRGGSLAGRTPGQTGGQGSDWPDFARGVATMHYAIAPSPRRLVRAALPSVSKYCPGQQMDGQVLVSA